MTREIIEIVAKEVRTVFVGDTFQNQTEVEEMFAERELLGSIQ